MASEKKPSIYYDRSTIGSSDELDEYGVWVKSEPQDLSSENKEPSLPDIGDIPDFDLDSALTGMAGDDSFSDVFGEAPVENTEEESAPTGVPPTGDFTEDMDFSDFTVDSFEDDALSDAQEPETSFDFSDLPEPDESGLSAGMDTDDPFDFAETSTENLLDNIPIGEELPRGEERDLKKTEDLPVESGDMPAEKPAARGTSSAPDLSTQLLMKIAEELSSIRVELSNLKQEFRVLRTEGSGEGPGESQGHGFFDEEDDEKISLTGDELDTILHTTDFTEESGKEDSVDLSLPVEEQEPEVSVAEPDDFVFEDDKIPENSEDSISIDLDLDFDLDEVSLEALKETEPVAEEQKPEEEISLDSGEFEIPLEIGDELDLSGGDNADLSFDLTQPEENPEFSLDPEKGELILDPAETAELEMLMEKGVEPMTPPPEDTSYLDEEPPLAEDSFAGISLDLSDAVIDEPDLSGKITENPPEEPALENIILDDLSVDELSEDISVTFDTREDEEEEIQISLPEELPAGEIQEEEIQEADDFSPVIPEAFEENEKDSPASFEEDLPEETIVEDALPDILEENAPGEEESLFDETGPEKAEELKTGDAGQNNETYYSAIPSNLQQELRTVLSYMDQLLESLPEEKIEEFAKSEYFDTYKKLFKELGLV